jgi:catechol 2,3-dioxygenase-like lactoylglutathione lyase family enzyme
MRSLAAVLVLSAAGLLTNAPAQEHAAPPKPTTVEKPAMVTTKESGPRLGNFSVSLTVKDVAASKAFYEKLGFHAVLGNGKTMQIMQNDTATIGLFQGAFDKNVLTFNPGWDRDMKTLADFDDVRAIQKALKARGLTLSTQADEAGTGPASLTVSDPDGNQILIDQHVPAPKK